MYGLLIQMNFLSLSMFLLFLPTFFTNVFTNKKLFNNNIEVFDLYNIAFNNSKVLENKDHYKTLVRGKRTLVLPGTLWCGIQNVAVYDEDLGIFALTDACCRDHEKCSFEKDDQNNNNNNDDNNNNEPTPKSYKSSKYAGERYKGEAICECEFKFYRCLRKTNTIISRNLGRLYFNVKQKFCFTFDHPSLHCIKYQGFFRLRCLEYAVNTSAPMIIEKRDNPFFL